MDSFAFIIHAVDPKPDVSRKLLLLGACSTNARSISSPRSSPVFISGIEGIVSAAAGREMKGWFIACPYPPRRMLELLRDKLRPQARGELQISTSVSALSEEQLI